MCNSSLTGTPRAIQFTPGTSTTPSARHVTENNENPELTPMKPVFGNDYIRGIDDPVEIARIRDITLTAEKLKRNLDDKYIYGDVSPLYSSLHHYCNNFLIIV